MIGYLKATNTKMIVEKNVMIPMRDGVRLAADIYRPDTTEKLPALLAFCPYGKDIQQTPLPFPIPCQERDFKHRNSIWDGNIEAGPTELFVSRGYIHVIADYRGIGQSEGEMCGVMYHPTQEGIDGHDIVEWIAVQPWCNGKVGGIGMSNLGRSQVRTALTKPPHYKSITPMHLHLDYPDRTGVMPSYMFWLYPGKDTNSGYTPKNVASWLVKNVPKAELDKLVENTLKVNPAIRYDSRIFKVLYAPQINPIMFDQIVMMHNPDYFPKQPRIPYEEIEIPIFMGGDEAYAGLELWKLIKKAPKKLYMWDGETYEYRPWRTDIEQILRWHDYWLKGIDNGIMDEPPVRIFRRGVEKWTWEQDYPIAGTEHEEWYLRSWERLSQEPEIPNDQPDCFLQEPIFVSVKRGELVYISNPLPEDIEVIGNPVAYLYAALTEPDTFWRVQLWDVDEAGQDMYWPKPISEGWLRSAFRPLDEEESTYYKPKHSGKIEAIEPNKVYEYAMDMEECAHVFKKGHRLKVRICAMLTTKDADSHTGWYTLSIAKPVLHKIYRDDEFKSRIILPVINRKAE